MKLLQQSLRIAFGALLVLMLATACSGGGGGDSDNDSTPGNGNGGGGGVDVSKTCQEQFNPDKAAVGDDCAPVYNQFCEADNSPLPAIGIINESAVQDCDGVTVTSGSATAGSLTSDYVVIQPTASSGKDALVVALHWADTNAATMANRTRLSELVKGRNVTVVVPTAPDPFPFRTWAPSSIFSPSSSIEDRVALLDKVIAQAQDTAAKAAGKAASSHVIILGDSGGGAFALTYMCQRQNLVTGAMFVAADIKNSDLASCTLTTPIATLQIHGSNDFIAPYAGSSSAAGVPSTFQQLYTQNGCTADDVETINLPVPSTDVGITGLPLQVAASCNGKGSALLTVNGGGHNYPGFSSKNFLPFNIYGFYTGGFDSTLQGYDLLRYLGA